MKIHPLCNSKPKIDLSKILSKKYLGNELARPMYKFVKLFTITNCKVYKRKTYNKTINDLIYRNKWHKAINKELWNLETY